MNWGKALDRPRALPSGAYWPNVETLLQVRDLRVQFRLGGATVHRAVDGVSFNVAAGEVVGLMGESGSGKTTVALALLRLLPQGGVDICGSAAFCGQELLTSDERSLQKIRGVKISLVSQEPGIALSPVLRIGDQIAEVLHAHRDWSWKQCRATAEGWLARVGLAPTKRFFSAYPHQLSGGELQRVVLAQALACEPTLLIADEPTASLDAHNQARFLALLRNMKEQLRISLLLISHAPEIQADLADRLVLIKDGRIVEQGSFAQLYRNPSCSYTRAMLQPRSFAGTSECLEREMYAGEHSAR